jgi:hypothetical protein
MIFLSYSWRDRDYALELRDRLRFAHLAYWLDSEHLDVGLPFRPQLSSAIDRASAVVLIDSRASRTSPWVQFERAVATSRRKPTILLAA